MANSQTRDRLLALLSLDLKVNNSYEEFRREYEHLFNFGLDRSSVTEQEFRIFQQLFDKIIWYSSFPEERAKIPNYIDEKEMESAVAEARRRLGIITE